ncbi:nitronate monooxygenase [Sphingobium sp. V4]|uniref:nitronate monooxygenase n=1 Tax=Sphingobium sp. V4 TaxID=3038927 RepID=UPI0025580047|nr:nitronate monooxygenase [Sphingobium sp. V4]WIW89467.1 nitronate monooxygenase [Sphingobium sp. V4]
MNNELCNRLDLEFPLFAFSHCRDVVAAVSRAGGFGVLGIVNRTPEEVEIELDWIDAHVQGRPYGVDLVFPQKLATKGEPELTYSDLLQRVPQAHKEFAAHILEAADVPPVSRAETDERRPPFDPASGRATLEVALRHPVKLVVNALGMAPQDMIDAAHARGVLVGALIGSKEHAVNQVAAGVDILIAQGTEAAGHCGEVSTMVLVPEVIEAVRSLGNVPVLAAGGIATGRQMAAAMAMGAAGAWTGSIWLATSEGESSPVLKDKMLAASSRDTVRTRTRTGKPCRNLRSAWTDAWENDPASPGPLPMPLMSLLSEAALKAADQAAQAGNEKARAIVTHAVGQGVGLIERISSAGSVVQDFKRDFLESVEKLNSLVSS